MSPWPLQTALGLMGGPSDQPLSVQVAGAELNGSTAEGFSWIPHDSLGVGWCLPRSWQLQARQDSLGSQDQGPLLTQQTHGCAPPPKNPDPLNLGKKSGTWCCGMPQDLGMSVQGDRPPWEGIQLSQWLLVLPNPVQSTVPWVSYLLACLGPPVFDLWIQAPLQAHRNHKPRDDSAH